MAARPTLTRPWFRRVALSKTVAGPARRRAEALKHGLILLTCGVNANVLRFLFPLTIQEPVFEEAMGILREALLC